jgi:hypothetical protein
MTVERFHNIILKLLEMICKDIVQIACYGHLVASDYMEYLLYAVVKLLLDIYLLAKSGGNIGLAYEGTLIVRLAIAVHTFLR